MNIFRRFNIYTDGVDIGTFYHEFPGDQVQQMLWHPKLTPAQNRRLVKKHRAATFRVDQDQRPIGRVNRLRRRFDRVENRRVRLEASQGGALRTWQQIVAPGPRPTGGARADRKHPSRKRDAQSQPTRVSIDTTKTPPWASQLPTVFLPGQPRALRRRDRRAFARGLIVRGGRAR